MGNRYYETGDFGLAEESFLAAKQKASDINDLSLELKITKNYTDKFINISSIAKNIKLVLDLKEKAIALQNDSLLFITYKMVMRQYVSLGTKMALRMEISDAMLVIAQKNNDSNMFASAYYSFGTATQGTESISYYRKSLIYSNWKKDKQFMGAVFNNLSARYRGVGDVQAAINCADSGYIASLASHRAEGMAASKYRLAEAYYLMNDFEKTIVNGKEALRIFKEAGILRRQNQCANVISAAYQELGKFELALEYFQLKVELTKRFAIMAEAEAAEFVNQKFAYELAQKRDSTSFAQERALNRLELETVNHLLSKERLQKYVLYGGSSMVLIFAVFIWISFKRKSRDNVIIENQKVLVEDKNQEIMDSIAYAKRIQSAILPPDQVVKEYLQESFVLYKPKDIVAGDFYWMQSVKGTGSAKENKVLFAAADCTGHGVPGAMVSVVCNNALNRSVREHGLTNPGEILTQTRKIVIQEFRGGQAGGQSEEVVKDGMDIAICSLEGMKLEYAGAHNPLWIVRDGELLETKANKQPIGQFDNPEPYTTHEIDLKPGDAIYIFSDGYVDQFGGPKGKKFKAKAFRALLLSIQDQTMEVQKASLEEAFQAWKGELEQLDDVCVIGVRV